MAVEYEIKEIKDAMLKHNSDDIESFGELTRRLQENHDVHIRNEEVLKNILNEAKKTNGRITNLEEYTRKLDVILAEIKSSNAHLTNIVSRQNFQYESWVKQQEDKYISHDRFNPIEKIVYGLVSLLLTGIVGSILVIILK